MNTRNCKNSPRLKDMRMAQLEREAEGRPARGAGPRDRHIRDADRAAQEGKDRGEAVRRDAPAPRRLRAAVRQRSAPRRRADPAAGLPLGRDHQGPQHPVGCARHAADQDPDGAPQRRPARRAGRDLRGVFGRHPARHHPPGFPAPLRPHRGHARHDAPAGGGRHHHARGLRQHRSQRHRLPDRRGLPDGIVRRHPLRQRPHLFPARARRHPGLRAQVQGGLLGLPGGGLRPDQLPRRRLHRQDAHGGRAAEARLRLLRRRRVWARSPTPPSCSTSSCPRRSCCR